MSQEDASYQLEEEDIETGWQICNQPGCEMPTQDKTGFCHRHRSEQGKTKEVIEQREPECKRIYQQPKMRSEFIQPKSNDLCKVLACQNYAIPWKDGYCLTHYLQIQKHDKIVVNHIQTVPCETPNCPYPAEKRGLCGKCLFPGKAKGPSTWEEAVRDTDLMRNYGITIDDWQNKHKAQAGVCKICKEPQSALDRNGKKRRLYVDHNHETNEVRDLLCGKCNLFLGFLETSKNPKQMLENFIKYCHKWDIA